MTVPSDTDGFTAPDTEVTEAVEAVRSVLVETLERAAKNLAEGERVPWSVLADAGLLALVVPEEHGGEGLGLDAVAVLSARPRPARSSSRCSRRCAAVSSPWPRTARTSSRRRSCPASRRGT